MQKCPCCGKMSSELKLINSTRAGVVVCKDCFDNKTYTNKKWSVDDAGPNALLIDYCDAINDYWEAKNKGESEFEEALTQEIYLRRDEVKTDCNVFAIKDGVAKALAGFTDVMLAEAYVLGLVQNGGKKNPDATWLLPDKTKIRLEFL